MLNVDNNYYYTIVYWILTNKEGDKHGMFWQSDNGSLTKQIIVLVLREIPFLLKNRLWHWCFTLEYEEARG